MVNIFSAFAIIQEIMKSSQVDLLKLSPHVVLITVQYLMKLINVYAGDKTTKEAEKTLTIIGRILNDSNDNETADLKKFLAQIRTRSLKIQNVFFVLDWSLILMVNF